MTANEHGWFLDQFGGSIAPDEAVAIETDEIQGAPILRVTNFAVANSSLWTLPTKLGWSISHVPIDIVLGCIRKQCPGADQVYLAAQQFVRAIEGKDKGLKKYTLSELVRLVKAQP